MLDIGNGPPPNLCVVFVDCLVQTAMVAVLGWMTAVSYKRCMLLFYHRPLKWVILNASVVNICCTLVFAGNLAPSL